MTAPDQTVPDELFGCWQRQWIEFADGSRDDTSFVVWLQLPSLMADVRLSPAALALAGRTSLSLSDQMVLAESDSSSGATVCTPVVEGTAVAEWSTAIGFQPVSASLSHFTGWKPIPLHKLETCAAAHHGGLAGSPLAIVPSRPHTP